MEFSNDSKSNVGAYSLAGQECLSSDVFGWTPNHHSRLHPTPNIKTRCGPTAQELGAKLGPENRRRFNLLGPSKASQYKFLIEKTHQTGQAYGNFTLDLVKAFNLIPRQIAKRLLVTWGVALSAINFWIRSLNPPACRRVLWIVLVSIACLGFSLRFVSPRGFFDSLTAPPLPPLALLFVKKIIFPTHFSSFNVEVLVLLIKKIIFPTYFSSFNVEVLVLLIKKIIFPTHFSSFNVEVLVLLVMKIIFPTHFSSFNVEALLLLVMKIIFPTHFSSFNVEVFVLLIKKIIFPTHFSSFNVEVLVLLIKKIIFPTHFSSFNVEVLVLLVMKIIFPTQFSSFNVEALLLFPTHFSSFNVEVLVLLVNKIIFPTHFSSFHVEVLVLLVKKIIFPTHFLLLMLRCSYF